MMVMTAGWRGMVLEPWSSPRTLMPPRTLVALLAFTESTAALPPGSKGSEGGLL